MPTSILSSPPSQPNVTPTQDDRQGIGEWHPATWDEYERFRDKLEDDPVGSDRPRLFFNNGVLKVDAMGWEGIDHAQVKDLFVMLLGLWYMAHPEQSAHSMGGCLLEKPGHQAAAPDLLLYVGEGAPRWQKGEPRRIDLNRWRVPDLVGEVADTTLDLDEMKQLYAALGIPEYWVVDVRGRRVLIFRLQADGRYRQVRVSEVLAGLAADLLEEALERSTTETNVSAAGWFRERLGKE
jgi:Uma2 family endonuclease